jgi:hypothetical protein
MTVALIDDQALGAVLRGSTPRRLRRRTLATTGHWYVRLCRAVLAASTPPGALSGPFEELPPRYRDRAVQALVELPEDVELVSLRDLGPAIGRIGARHRLNILQAEALAAAEHLDAEVFLTTPSPLLETALATEGRRVHLL